MTRIEDMQAYEEAPPSIFMAMVELGFDSKIHSHTHMS